VGKLRVVKKHEKIPNELLYSFPNFSSFCQAVKVWAENTNEDECIKVGHQDILDFIKTFQDLFKKYKSPEDTDLVIL